jgi:hypothetical protein
MFFLYPHRLLDFNRNSLRLHGRAARGACDQPTRISEAPERKTVIKKSVTFELERNSIVELRYSFGL